MVLLHSVLVILLTCILGTSYVLAQGQYLRVCYYTNWAQYRPKAMKFFPEDVDPNLCTHLVYAFAKLNGNRLVAFEWNDESTEWMRGMYDRFNGIKSKNPGIKTLIAVGGWNMGSKPFTKMVATPASRREFATSTVKFLRDRNFDGVDMDWEYPANRGSPPEDRHRFTQLLSEIRRTFDEEGRRTGREPLLLTSAVAAGKSKIDTGYDIPQFCRDMDFVSLMAYDLHGSWENITGHNSPLYPHSGETGDQRFLNMDWASNYWVQMGCPRNKLIIGMGLYGRSFTLKDYHRHGLMDPVKGKGKAGKYTREGGFLAYYEICEMQRQGANTYYIKEQEAPYVVLGNQWVGYDDVDSLRIKVRWMKQNSFGGVMVWALDLDDFKNTCDFGPYPLLNAINQELGAVGAVQAMPPRPARRRPRPRPPVPQVPVQHRPVQPTPMQPRPVQSHPVPQRPQHRPVQPVFTQQPPPTPPPTPPQNVIAPQVSREFTCPPISNSEPSPNPFHASPWSCSEYFMCVDDVPIKFTCASPLIWDERNNFCEWPRKMKCNKGNSNQFPPVPKPRPPPPKRHIFTTPKPTTPAPTTTARRWAQTTQYVPFNAAENTLANRIPTWLEWSRWIAEFWNALATSPAYWMQGTSNTIQNTVPLMQDTAAAPVPFIQQIQPQVQQSQPVAMAQPNTVPQQVPIAQTLHLVQEAPGANFCDGKADGFHIEPHNCQVYIQCVAGTEYRTSCPTGTAFDETYGVCDFTENVKRCTRQGING